MASRTFFNKVGSFVKPPDQARNENYATWLRVRFIHYYLLASLLIIIATGLVITIMVQIPGLTEIDLNAAVTVSMISLILLYTAAIILLKQGFVKIVTHLVLVLAFAAIWTILFFDTNAEIAKLDSIIYLIVLLSTTAILLASYKWAILVYSAGNLVMAFVFSRYYFGPGDVFNEYLIDVGVSIILVGLIAFFSSRINQTALEKALNDIRAREEAEASLVQSEKKFREMTELLPQSVFEADLSGRLVYVNRTALQRFGFDFEDIKKGLSVFDTLDPSEHPRASENIGRILQGEILAGNSYRLLTKNGDIFEGEIYARLVLEDDKPVGIRGLIVDISERLQVARELKDSRDRYQSLVNNIPGITYRCRHDQNWTMIFMSSEIERLSGYPSSDFIENQKRSFASVIHPEDLDRVSKEVGNAVSAGVPWEIEYRIKHRDGSIRWAYEKGQAISNGQGEVEYLDGVILDITRRKLAEQAMIQSENRYRHLFFHAPIALAEIHQRGVITSVNKQFTLLLGYTSDDIPHIDLWWQKIFPEENYRSEMQAIWKRLIREAESDMGDINPLECRLTAKQGGERIVLIGTSVFQDTILVSLVDITERKLAESALLESEERYRMLIEAFPDVVMISDYKGNIVFGNRKLEEITGITSADYSNPGRKAHIHPDDFAMVSEATIRLIKSQDRTSGYIENRFIDAMGRIHFLSGIMSKIIWQGQEMIQTISRDITEKKQIEQELEQHRLHLETLVNERTDELAVTNEELSATNDELQNLNDELLRKNQIINEQNEKLRHALDELKKAQMQLVQSEKMASLGTLTAGIAHEINNPLNFIQGAYEGLSDFMLEKNLIHEEKVKILLHSIQTGVERASSIVRGLNQFNRSKDVFNENCDLHNILDNCLLMLNFSLRDRIRIERHYESRKIYITGNGGKLHQVFLNVLQNAVQAIDKEGVIRVGTNMEINQVIVTIADSGHGISNENIQRVLDPFFTTKEPGMGTGLGLAISYSIILEHSGTLEIESEPGKEPCYGLFCLFLPPESDYLRGSEN
ncbi:MAG: PAS domain S-box protein [Bacteroidales bacterium]